MNSGTASSIVASARRHRAEADAAERAVLDDAIAWCAAHEVTADDTFATWGDSPIPIAGENAPLISEFCIDEFAAALGMTAESGRRYLSAALELSARLPQTLAEIRAGRLRVWRGQAIAQSTLDLSGEAAAFVDAMAGPFAARMSRAAVQRVVDEAIARFMPEKVQQTADFSADARRMVVDHRQVSFNATSAVYGELDLRDALDLDHTLSRGAAQIATLHPDLSLDVRRALALGALARGEQMLAGAGAGPEEPGTDAARVSSSSTNKPTAPEASAQELVLHLHLSPDTDVAYLEAGKRLLTRDQVAEWCGKVAKVTVKPVIDLHHQLTAQGYEIPDRIREHVTSRDRTCVFPWCERNSRSCDLDHIEPWDEGGETSTVNLAPLCRRHHRLKTHGGWHYQMVEPGTYHWQSPLGQRFVTDRSGTRDLTPKPVAPPGSRPAA